MLRSANVAFLAGQHVLAAARLKEALRRHLASLATLHGLDDGGDTDVLLGRLQTADVPLCCWAEDLATECDEVLALRDAGRQLGFGIELAFGIVDGGCER